MDIASAILDCLKKSFDFRGRARRREFWIFLVFWIVVAVLSVLSVPPHPLAGTLSAKLLAAAPLILPLGLLLPLSAVAVRRLHDINVSGWWLLSAAAPIPVLDVLIVGAQVVCFAKPGTAGDNRYGPDPRGRL